MCFDTTVNEQIRVPQGQLYSVHILLNAHYASNWFLTIFKRTSQLLQSFGFVNIAPV